MAIPIPNQEEEKANKIYEFIDHPHGIIVIEKIIYKY